jgi:hypothetical protein
MKPLVTGLEKLRPIMILMLNRAALQTKGLTRCTVIPQSVSQSARL